MKRKSKKDKYANDQTQYHLNGKLVSKEDFYKYGFRHGTEKKTEICQNCGNDSPQKAG